MSSKPPPLRSVVTLSAVRGEPLKDHLVRASVVAAAQSLAERNGLRVHHLATTDASIQVELEASEVEAVGFVSELRTITNTWYERRFRDGPMWGTA